MHFLHCHNTLAYECLSRRFLLSCRIAQIETHFFFRVKPHILKMRACFVSKRMFICSSTCLSRSLMHFSLYHYCDQIQFFDQICIKYNTFIYVYDTFFKVKPYVLKMRACFCLQKYVHMFLYLSFKVINAFRLPSLLRAKNVLLSIGWSHFLTKMVFLQSSIIKNFFAQEN